MSFGQKLYGQIEKHSEVNPPLIIVHSGYAAHWNEAIDLCRDNRQSTNDPNDKDLFGVFLEVVVRVYVYVVSVLAWCYEARVGFDYVGARFYIGPPQKMQ